MVKIEGAFGHLAAWFPGDERAALQLCLSGASFKTVDPADFRKCCEILDVENADLMQNPVAKAVVKAHHKGGLPAMAPILLYGGSCGASTGRGSPAWRR